MKNSIDIIGHSNKCSGCTACLNTCSKQAILMCVNDKGFLYPVINKEKCVHCNLCLDNCPWLIEQEIKEESSDFYVAKRTNFKKRLSPGEGKGYSLQYFCLENSIDWTSLWLRW